MHRFVWERFGLSLCRSSCLTYLRRLGFAFKRPKKRLLKADEEKREAFVAAYAALRVQLLDDMPAELHALAAENPVTVDVMHHALANKTAARFSDLDGVVLELAQAREFDIINADGKPRSRKLIRLGATDRIAVPPMRLFPGWPRMP